MVTVFDVYMVLSGSRAIRRPSTVLQTLGGQQDDAALTTSEVFEVLRNFRRRHTITYLRKQRSTISMEQLTRQIAAIENDMDPEDVTPTQYKRVYTGLYQCHLPKLDNLGVVEFDSANRTVQLGPSVAAVIPYISDGVTRMRKAILATAMGVSLVTGLWLLNVDPVSIIPEAFLGIVVIGTLLTLSVVRLRDSY